jgi:hypothetical protein
MPKRQPLAKQIINKARSSDQKAAALALDQIHRSEGSAKGPVMIEVDQPENKLVMESIIRRIRMTDEAPAGIDAAGDGGKDSK